MCLVMSNFNDNMCIVTLTRDVTNDYGTFGILCFDGLKFCTLEPVKPIINKGNYLVTFTFSPRFSSKQPYCKFEGVPLVNGVKGHGGLRIHVGNYKSDTQGCILVGSHRDDTMIFDSRKSYCDLMQRVQQRLFYNSNTFYVLEVK